MTLNALRRFAIASALVLGAGPALAAEGLPQLNPETFSPQIVWLAITFAVMLLVMGRLALPRVASVLEERRERIDGDLDKAAKMRAEAEEIMAAYEKRLAEARAEAHALQRTTAEQIAAAAATAQDALTRELAAETRAAETRIEAAKTAALSHVREIAVDVAGSLVGRLTGAAGEARRIEAAVDASMEGRH